MAQDRLYIASAPCHPLLVRLWLSPPPHRSFTRSRTVFAIASPLSVNLASLQGQHCVAISIVDYYGAAERSSRGDACPHRSRYGVGSLSPSCRHIPPTLSACPPYLPSAISYLIYGRFDCSKAGPRVVQHTRSDTADLKYSCGHVCVYAYPACRRTNEVGLCRHRANPKNSKNVLKVSMKVSATVKGVCRRRHSCRTRLLTSLSAGQRAGCAAGAARGAAGRRAAW